jgi:hypothetical protein
MFEFGSVMTFDSFMQLVEQHGTSVYTELAATGFWTGLHA